MSHLLSRQQLKLNGIKGSTRSSAAGDSENSKLILGPAAYFGAGHSAYTYLSQPAAALRFCNI